MKPQTHRSVAGTNEHGFLSADPDLPALSTVFGPDVLTAASRFDAESSALPARKRAGAAAARVSRQREFATGRSLARSLMAQLGIANAQVPANRDRSPAWPRGVVGSISHADGVCVVALARSEHFLGLGVDIEPNRPVEPGLIETICTERERAWLAKQAPESRGSYARLMFSAKECAFKCQYPLTKTFLEYGDVGIEVDLRRARFSAGVRCRASRQADTDVVLHGRFCASAKWIVTGLTLRNITSVATQY